MALKRVRLLVPPQISQHLCASTCSPVEWTSSHLSLTVEILHAKPLGCAWHMEALCGSQSHCWVITIIMHHLNYYFMMPQKAEHFHILPHPSHLLASAVSHLVQSGGLGHAGLGRRYVPLVCGQGRIRVKGLLAAITHLLSMAGRGGEQCSELNAEWGVGKTGQAGAGWGPGWVLGGGSEGLIWAQSRAGSTGVSRRRPVGGPRYSLNQCI